MKRGYQVLIQETNGKYPKIDNEQDEHIRRRLNKHYFKQMMAISELKANPITNSQIQKHQKLPINIVQFDNLFNQLAVKYKEHELVIQPKIEDIYNDLDIALKKVSIRITPGLAK